MTDNYKVMEKICYLQGQLQTLEYLIPEEMRQNMSGFTYQRLISLHSSFVNSLQEIKDELKKSPD
jgi:hypothetical protein